jgi:hypothetical protein
MKTYYSISIPEPCHEDWNKMTPKDKGRFCDSCSKTVIDFTKMNSNEIQNFITQNQEQRICGHFKQTQLESIHLHVPIQTFASRSFHKLFLLALLITMGISLFSCTKTNGAKQKIDSVEIIDSISHKVISIDTLEMVCDTTSKPERAAETNENIQKPPKPLLTGIVVTKAPEQKKDTITEIIDVTTGDVVIENTTQGIDSIPEIEVEGIIALEEENTILGFIYVDTPPQFKGTPNNLSVEEKRKYFQKQVNDIVTKKFNPNLIKELGLSGRQRIYAMFTINKNGKIEDIKIRAPHFKLEEETRQIIESLPTFIPGKQRNITVPVIYTLPIVLEVED